MTYSKRTPVYLALHVAIAAAGIYSCASDGFGVFGLLSAYILLMILPGAALYILANNKPDLLELALSSVVLSPVLTGVPAGERRGDGHFPPNSVNGAVQRRLQELADHGRAYGAALPDCE